MLRARVQSATTSLFLLHSSLAASRSRPPQWCLRALAKIILTEKLPNCTKTYRWPSTWLIFLRTFLTGVSIAVGQSSQNDFAVQLDIWKFNTTAKDLWGNNVGIADNMPFENGSQIQVLPAPETFLEATTDPTDTDHPSVSNCVFYVFGQCFAAAFVHVSLGCG